MMIILLKYDDYIDKNSLHLLGYNTLFENFRIELPRKNSCIISIISRFRKLTVDSEIWSFNKVMWKWRPS